MDYYLLLRFDLIFINPVCLNNLTYPFYLAKWNFDFNNLNKTLGIKSICDNYEIENNCLDKVMSKGLVDYYVLIKKDYSEKFSLLFDYLYDYLKVIYINLSYYYMQCN